VLRQAVYILLFGGMVMYFGNSGRVRMVASVPTSTWLVLGWMLLSVVWSVAPDITLRRGVLVVIVTLSVLMSVDALGPDRALRILARVLAFVIVVDLISIPLIPGATHPYMGGTAWAGLHHHKNLAGAIATLAALLFLHFALRDRSWKPLVLYVLATIFLIGTQSKTSLALLAALSIVMPVYRACEARPRGRILFRAAFFGSLLALVAVGFAYWDEMMMMLDDRTLLTGRGQLWQIVMAYARDHLWLGAGFGAFWTGPQAPSRQFVSSGWAIAVGHSHNSYMEMLATLGLVGVVLTVIAFVIVPLRRALSFRVVDGAGALAFAWILFGLIGNITKSQFLDRDRPEWVILVLAIGILHATRSQTAAPARPLAQTRRQQAPRTKSFDVDPAESPSYRPFVRE